MQYQAPQHWLADVWQQPPFTQLAPLNLQSLSAFPDCQWLNQHWSVPVQFISQSAFEQDGRYYEEIIFQSGQVPTRSDNYHDLFNAAIWAQLPQSKAVLNAQHMADIAQHGLNPRTPRRNRITQFDECGVVLAYHASEIPKLLSQHQWHQAFVELRQQWGKRVHSFVFGHANFEMLLNPFIGLTGKWLGIEVDSNFAQLSATEQHQQLDSQLAALLKANIFAEKGYLSPLPLLGVPGWYAKNKNAEFYNNSAYFMAKRSK